MSNESEDRGYTDEELASMDTDLSVDEVEVKRHPISMFVREKKEMGKDPGYTQSLKSLLREFREFLSDQHNEHLCNIDDTAIRDFNEHLKGGEKYVTNTRMESEKFRLKNRTREDYLSRLVVFYNWLVENGVISTNPAQKALADLRDRPGEFGKSRTDRPKIELQEMQEFLEWLKTPFQRAFVLLLLKTGVRSGEARNIDLRDLNLDHPLFKHYVEEYDILTVDEVKDKPDTLFIQPGFRKGTVVRGEERTSGQKRKREDGSVIPVDHELKTALIEYLLVRPLPKRDVPCHPLFVTDRNETTERMGRHSTRHFIIKKALGEYGWWESGAGIEQNIDLHYFRHYFTHNHKHMSGVYSGYLPEGVLAYIRGDVDSGSTSRNTDYSHGSWDDWERTVKQPYLDGVYQFGIYD